MTGAIEQVGKTAESFIDVMKREPLSLALVLMNLCLLLFFYVILTRVADQRKEEIGLLYADKKDVRELLARCIVPNDRRSDDFQLPRPTPLQDGADPPKPGRSELKDPPKDPT
jgi:hypothetical protein